MECFSLNCFHLKEMYQWLFRRLVRQHEKGSKINFQLDYYSAVAEQQFNLKGLGEHGMIRNKFI